jgi:hypothetical protein
MEPPLGFVWPNAERAASLGFAQPKQSEGRVGAEPRFLFQSTGFATDWSFKTANRHNRSERKNSLPCKQQEKYRRIFNRKASTPD